MRWEKKGLIAEPGPHMNFGEKRLMCPTPFLLNKDTIRIYTGFCGIDNISRPGYIDVSAASPQEIRGISKVPLLDIGEPGMFDDNGLCPTCVLKVNGKILMYYFGFQLGIKLPFYMFSGLAVSTDGDSWKRYSRVPVLDRSDKEPIMRSGPFVIYEEGTFKLYYPTGDEFLKVNGKTVHTYNLHYLESGNGYEWGGEGKTVIALKNDGDEYGFGRPFVFKEHNLYKMVYSLRTYSKGYRLGYAESANGIDWIRKDDEMGIDVSENGWDSEMICYGAYFRHNDKAYLFYNGNNLGDTGIGYAELVQK